MDRRKNRNLFDDSDEDEEDNVLAQQPKAEEAAPEQ